MNPAFTFPSPSLHSIHVQNLDINLKLNPTDPRRNARVTILPIACDC